MKMKAEEHELQAELILSHIVKRSSIFPNSFLPTPIEPALLQKLMEVANTAPTHRLTQPWRFKIVTGAGLKRLSGWMGDKYLEMTPPSSFSIKKHEKTKQKPIKSGAVILICMQRDPQESLPEWEEIAAVACAVQNFWLAAGALGLGGYWSSPKMIESISSFTPLAEGERCLGLFYLGYHNQMDLPKKRTPSTEKVKWINS